HKVTQAIRVAVELGLPDRIAAGTHDPEELAVASRARPPSLRRLLRALGAIGIVTSDKGGHVGMTPIGEGLRSDAAEPLAGGPRSCGSDDTARTWGASCCTGSVRARAPTSTSTAWTRGSTG